MAKKQKPEPKSIFQQSKDLKLKAEEILPLLHTEEKTKIKQGHTWQRIDDKTRVLVKKKS